MNLGDPIGYDKVWARECENVLGSADQVNQLMEEARIRKALDAEKIKYFCLFYFKEYPKAGPGRCLTTLLLPYTVTNRGGANLVNSMVSMLQKHCEKLVMTFEKNNE